jgi:hypothetical protein
MAAFFRRKIVLIYIAADAFCPSRHYVADTLCSRKFSLSIRLVADTFCPTRFVAVSFCPFTYIRIYTVEVCKNTEQLYQFQVPMWCSRDINIVKIS